MEPGKHKCIIIGLLGKVLVGYGIPGEGYNKIQVDEMREHITEKWKGTQHRRRDKGHIIPKCQNGLLKIHRILSFYI